MKRKFEGITDAMFHLVEEKQLKSRELWSLVEEPFGMDWDDEDRGWRGEYWGKLMRGACMSWKYSRDEELYGILEESVRHILTKQDADGRITGYSKENEFTGWDMWERKYVLMGFLHFQEICRDSALREQVLNAACRQLDYILVHIGRGEGQIPIEKTSHIWGNINSSSILETVVWLYRLRSEKRYLDFASYIIDNGGAENFDLFETAYEDKLFPYQYPVVKAYEMMSCFEGLMEYASLTENEKWMTASLRFVNRLMESETTVIGSLGCKCEEFNHSALMQTFTGYTGRMLETCVTVTWMKLLRRAYNQTGDCRYLEEIEKAGFNALLGAIDTKNNGNGPESHFDGDVYRSVYRSYRAAGKGSWQAFDSYSPLLSGIRGQAIGGFKPIHEKTAFCGCCIAIGAAGLPVLLDSAVIPGEDGFAFGTYIPGETESAVGEIPVRLRVETAYPSDGKVKIIVEPEKTADFAISLRIPSFAVNATVQVNKEEPEQCEAGAFYRISRTWSSGDEICLNLDMNPRLAFGMKNPEDPLSEHYMAVLYGPLVLARDKQLGAEGEPVKISEKKLTLRRRSESVIPCQCAFDVTVDGTTFPMIDYASAGKTWRRDSEMEAWMLTEDSKN